MNSTETMSFAWPWRPYQERVLETTERHLCKRLGPAELVYTRNLEGRRILLKARARSFSSRFAARTERRDRWQ